MAGVKTILPVWSLAGFWTAEAVLYVNFLALDLTGRGAGEMG